MCNAALVTPERFWAAALFFHAFVLASTGWLTARWADPARCQLPCWPWLRRLGGEAATLAVSAYVVSLIVTLAANLDQVPRLRVGPITGRLMAEALFGESILLAFALAWRHRRARAPRKAVCLALAGVVLLGGYAEAYRIEPFALRIERHLVDRTFGARSATALRILHITDIQTPLIGRREADALASGIALHPDLIVLTGDYVQDALGRPTEAQAASDLRALIRRIGFRAPLGAFATEGDVGPRCREVFAGTIVRCLVDETTSIPLGDGSMLAITGLSRGGGRTRDSVWLSRTLRVELRPEHHLVISHSPDFVDALRERVDLALAGHTHGGQVVLPFFGPLKTASRLPRRYAGGLNDYEGIPLHVSRGVGIERGFDPPVRFLCPPEICILDVRFASGPRAAMVEKTSLH